MEFTIKREPFLKELALLQDVASRKHDNNPIRACVKIEARESELLLDATDADVSMGCICNASDGLSVEETGVAVVDAKRLRSYIGGMESTEVVCTTDEQEWLSIWYPDRRDGKPLYRMPGFPTKDFPTVPEPPDAESENGWKSSSLPAPVFANMETRAQYAISGDRGSMTIHGALLEFAEDAARMVATDGNKLVVAAYKSSAVKPWDVMIPRRALAAIAAMCRSLPLGGSVEITRGPNHVFAYAGGRMVASTMLAAQFPPWRNIMQKGVRAVKFAALDTKRFKACASRAAAVLDDKGLGGLKLQFTTSNILRFNAQSSLFGEADEWMDIGYKLDEKAAENMADKDLIVRLGHAYLLDFLGTCQSEVIKITGSDASSPVKLIDGDLEADGFQVECVIMTINEAVAAQAAEIAQNEKKEKAEKKSGRKEPAAPVEAAPEKTRRRKK